MLFLLLCSLFKQNASPSKLFRRKYTDSAKVKNERGGVEHNSLIREKKEETV